MSLEGDIRTALLAMSAVSNLVGSGDAARIRPYILHESDNKELSHIIVEVDEKPRDNFLDGKLAGGLIASVNLSCRAMTRTAANALAEAVRVNGTNPGTGMAGYGGSGTAFDSWLDQEDPGLVRWDDGSKRVWHTVEQLYRVYTTETT